MAAPRISIVTACFNAADYIEAAIDSVLGQACPGLEYVIIDGGSTDGTVDVIRKHESRLTYWVSEADRGHGDALQKGFARTSGDVMGWLNADDVLHPGAVRLLQHLFESFPDVEWLTGQPSHVDAEGRPVAAFPPRRWSRLGFLTGDHRWIQQESTFWRRSLWQRAGGYVSSQHALACDFELWMRFFRHAPLHSTWGLLGAFRFREGQRSRSQRDAYDAEVREILTSELRSLMDNDALPTPVQPWPASPPVLVYDWQAMRYTRKTEEVKASR